MKSALLLFILPSLAHAIACPTDQKKDEQTLVRIENAWVRAAEQHDTASLACILAGEFEEADFTGSLSDRQMALANAMNTSRLQFTLTDLHAHVYGDVAYVRGVGIGRDRDRVTVKTRFTDIFVYRDGRWRCVAGHESHFPKP